MIFRNYLPFICVFSFVELAAAQGVPTFSANPQHTSVYQPPAQDLNRIRWSTSIDENNTSFAHYGAPIITASNSLITPVKTAGIARLSVESSGSRVTHLTTPFFA